VGDFQAFELLVIEGVLFTALAVVGQLVSDGAIELVQLDIDTSDH
jgi:hypothetical protein